MILLTLVVLGLGLGIVLCSAAYELWIDHELAKAEQERERRRVLEVAHRIPVPFDQKASQGGPWQKKRASL